MYRSIHRGCKETDYIFGEFAKDELDKLDEAELDEYERLLSVDDSSLYKWFTGLELVPDEWNNNIFQRVQQHIKNKRAECRVFIIAGEASGDILGGKLIDAIKELNSNAIVYGIGGASMAASGAKLIFHYSDIAVMGYAELIPRLPRILWRMWQTIKAIKEIKPNVVITIDSLGFNGIIAAKVRGHAPLIHYVAPTVWAYKPERAAKVAALYDHLLVLFAFEKPYFDAVGLNTTVVGHPIVEETIAQNPQVQLIDEHNKSIVVMVGSRRQEIRTLGPIFAEALSILQTQYNLRLKITIPTLPHLRQEVEALFTGLEVHIVTDELERKLSIQQGDVGIIKSGTAVLEAAYYGLPAVVGYKVSALTYYLLKKMVKVRYISLPNILLDEEVLPELMQSNCTPITIAQNVMTLLEADKQKYIKQRYKEMVQKLRNNSAETPSKLAAHVILEHARKFVRGIV